MTPTLLECVRFGFGPRAGEVPGGARPDPARLIAQLDAPVDVPTALLLPDRLDILRQVRRDQVAMRGRKPELTPATDAARALLATDGRDWITAPARTDQGFRERLVYFWMNRLTVGNRNNDNRYFLLPYRDEAIRPHVAGRFADMLAASAWHPAMLLYLDQAASSGPGSAFGRRRKAGLNENFAREFLELHSMGSGYDQTDVTELARLFTGMTYRREDGPGFMENRAEPGIKTILDETYGTGPDEIARLIATVARRPETARSVALALARHFLMPQPPADLVDRMTAAYLRADTGLVPVYRVMLDHPAAGDPTLHNMRSPLEYLAATLRALDVPLDEPKLKLGEQMRRMGQPVFRPDGPDGWPETAEIWISGPGIAARLRWAEMLARSYGQGRDPRVLAPRLLGNAHAHTIRAVAQAEQKWEGLAILLSAPDFMRR